MKRVKVYFKDPKTNDILGYFPATVEENVLKSRNGFDYLCNWLLESDYNSVLVHFDKDYDKKIGFHASKEKDLDSLIYMFNCVNPLKKKILVCYDV